RDEVFDVPIVVAGGRPEPRRSTAGTVGAPIVANEVAVVPADDAVDAVGVAGVIVVARGEDEVDVPGMDEIGNARLVGRGGPVVAENGEANRAPKGGTDDDRARVARNIGGRVGCAVIAVARNIRPAVEGGIFRRIARRGAGLLDGVRLDVVGLDVVG